MAMEVTFLGTGTSMGIPMIGCRCETCSSPDPRDKRLRTSVWIHYNDKHVIIDSGIDFRQQALEQRIPSIDAVLFTHHHVDHIFGLDELRPINFLQNKTVIAYGTAQTKEHLKRVYPYVFEGHNCPSDVPKIEYRIFDNTPFKIDDLEIIPIPLFHGELPVTGFRLGSFAYCTDVSRIPKESYELLRDLDVLVLGALRNSPHPTHFTLTEAVEEARNINAAKTYFVHMSHELRHKNMLEQLPVNMAPAFDGLKISL
jgi:phosphoribosyl 1,2-cyclic phosphate phosphodiesterase